MFSDTKYTRWYYTIVSAARQHQRVKCSTKYYEMHHIVPKALGGTNEKTNLVLLTAREHYICHLLLPKMCITSDHKRRMVYALMRLSEGANKYNIKHRYTGKLYEYFKKRYIAMISGPNSYMYGVPKSVEYRKKISQTRKERGLAQGENNPMYGRNHTVESKQNMSSVKKQRIEERGVDCHKARAIAVNPRSRQVQTPDGRVFPSLSEAGRVYGFVGLTAPQLRIRKGEWWYL